jgi:hypothetical protein
MSQWVAFKAAIAEKVEWFRGFDKPFSELLNEAIENNPIERFDYDPLLVDALLKDVASLLDKCLAYRRDAQDLEILAVRAAADYSKFVDLLPIQQEAEVIAQGLSRLGVERSAAAKAASEFRSTESRGPVERGFEAVELGKVAAIDQQVITSTRQVELIESRWKLTKRYEDEAQARHTAKGNSHNYGDRMTRLLRFLAEDFQEAYLKAAALCAGIEVMYGRKFELPDIRLDSAIDDVVHVVRGAARFIEQEVTKFSLYDIVVPLCQPLFETDGVSHPLVKYEDLKAAIESGRWIEFDLAPALRNVKSARLRGVGLSFGNELSRGLDPGQLPEMSAYRLTAQLAVPEQTVGGTKLKRPPVYFGNVAVFSGSTSVAWNASNSCYNGNPLGKWRIKIAPRAVHSIRIEKFSKSLVEDLKLHLSLSALLAD